MPKYEVQLLGMRFTSTYVVVEADNLDAAIDEAVDKALEDEVTWDDADLDYSNIDVDFVQELEGA